MWFSSRHWFYLYSHFYTLKRFYCHGVCTLLCLALLLIFNLSIITYGSQFSLILYYYCYLHRKLIVPQKEPSPLLSKKIEELEAKFADMTDEELEDLGDEDGDLRDHSLPQMQSSMSSDMDIMPFTPPQVWVKVFSLQTSSLVAVRAFSRFICGFLVFGYTVNS